MISSSYTHRTYRSRQRSGGARICNLGDTAGAPYRRARRRCSPQRRAGAAASRRRRLRQPSSTCERSSPRRHPRSYITIVFYCFYGQPRSSPRVVGWCIYIYTHVEWWPDKYKGLRGIRGRAFYTRWSYSCALYIILRSTKYVVGLWEKETN